MVETILVNQALEFLLDYGAIFLILMIAYEALKLVFGGFTDEDVNLLRDVGSGVGWGAGKAGPTIAEAARQAAKIPKIPGQIHQAIGKTFAREISDIKTDIQTQETLLRETFNKINQVYSSLETQKNPDNKFTAADLKDENIAKDKITNWVLLVKKQYYYSDLTQPQIQQLFINLNKHLNQLRKTVKYEEDSDKKQVIKAMMTTVEQFILREDDFWKTVLNFQNALNGLGKNWKTTSSKKNAPVKITEYVKKVLKPRRDSAAYLLNDLVNLKNSLK